jgi:hypothetical protein
MESMPPTIPAAYESVHCPVCHGEYMDHEEYEAHWLAVHAPKPKPVRDPFPRNHMTMTITFDFIHGVDEKALVLDRTLSMGCVSQNQRVGWASQTLNGMFWVHSNNNTSTNVSDLEDAKRFLWGNRFHDFSGDLLDVSSVEGQEWP